MDRAEGLGNGYDENPLTVFDTEGNAHAVLAYVASDTHIDDTLKPYSWYVNLVVRGAVARSLPGSYVDRISEHPSLADTNFVRAQKADLVCS